VAGSGDVAGSVPAAVASERLRPLQQASQFEKSTIYLGSTTHDDKRPGENKGQVPDLSLKFSVEKQSAALYQE
jgi:hypothetical protein